jgi:glycosyltransferase involved in cell wall biosynthesis
MKYDTPLISVIMPVHNAEIYLKQSIESILGQSYTNFEFIIIDDGSNDSSYEIAKSYNDKRIKVVKQDQRGVAISLNKGISISNGEIIARQDADDISMFDRFEIQIKYLKEHPEVCLLGTIAQLIDKDGNFIKNLDFPVNNEKLQKYILEINPFIHGSLMIRKICLKQVGMYREQFLLAQSYDLWLRIAEKFEIANIPLYLYKYRVWDNAVSNEKAALFRLFSEIALECTYDRRAKGVDSLMTGNNYSFYEKYGKKIVDTYGEKEVFRWLKTS